MFRSTDLHESVVDCHLPVDAGRGIPPFGRYPGMPAAINFQSLEQGLAGALRRRTMRKAWWFVGAFTEDFSIGFAICDAGYAGIGFAYVYNRKSGELIEEGAIKVLAFAQNFSPNLQQEWQLKTRKAHWELKPQGGMMKFQFSGQRLSLKGEVIHDERGMSAFAPADTRPFNHTYKRVGAQVNVAVTADNKVTENISGPFAALDFTAGYPPRHTRWNWAAFVGTTADGVRVGVNLVQGFNDGLENALWLDDDLIPLGAAEFHYPADPLSGPWHVVTTDGALKFSFEPSGARFEEQNHFVIRSSFIQPFGKFMGSIQRNGKAMAFTAFGVVEEHDSLW